MASLKARHTRACGKGWATFDEAKGCECRPTFYVRTSEGGKLHPTRIGRNRKEAERALNRVAVAVDDDTFQAPRKTFEGRRKDWTKALERKPATVQSYEQTFALASRVFGGKQLSKIGAEDLAELNRQAREAGASASTRAKHQRVVHACLSAAQDRGYIAKVPKLPKGERPSASKREAAYFEDAELPRLFREIPEGVYRVLAATAVETGCRVGEAGRADVGRC